MQGALGHRADDLISTVLRSGNTAHNIPIDSIKLPEKTTYDLRELRTSLDPSAAPASDIESGQQNASTLPKTRSFMDLPCEIRMQIYTWIYHMSPVPNRTLATPSPSPLDKPYPVRPIPPPKETTQQDLDSPNQDFHPSSPYNSRPPNHKILLLTPSPPTSSLPTPLLQATPQIYHEARTLPFHKNEFVFAAPPPSVISDLMRATSHARRQQQWQRDAMRRARLNVSGLDFRERESRLWDELCDLWAGLRGLRIRMVVSPGGVLTDAGRYFASAVLAMAKAEGGDAGIQEGEGFADGMVRDEGPREWMVRWAHALAKLSSLRHIEIEIMDVVCDDAIKAAWATELASLIRDARAPGSGCDVTVTCVVRVNAEGPGFDEKSVRYVQV